MEEIALKLKSSAMHLKKQASKQLFMKKVAILNITNQQLQGVQYSLGFINNLLPFVFVSH